MSAIRAQLRTRGIAGILLAIVAAFVCAPAGVEASCGHYVRLGSQSARPEISPARDSAWKSGDDWSAENTVSSPLPGPCEGPTCSKEPVSPTTPHSIPLRISAEEWAGLAQQERNGPSLLELLSRGLDAREISAPTSRIFRPPRRSVV